MPEPEDVNPHNFKVERVLFNESGFSIASGTWEDGTQRLGMRWDGEDEDPGYPKTFGHPVWFVLPERLTLPLVKALLGCEGARDPDIVTVLAARVGRHDG